MWEVESLIWAVQGLLWIGIRDKFDVLKTCCPSNVQSVFWVPFWIFLLNISLISKRHLQTSIAVKDRLYNSYKNNAFFRIYILEEKSKKKNHIFFPCLMSKKSCRFSNSTLPHTSILPGHFAKEKLRYTVLNLPGEIITNLKLLKDFLLNH